MSKSAERLCAVSVDLDEIPNYFAIHGLPLPTGPEAHAVYRTAIGRIESLASWFRMPLTLFAVASDLRDANSACKLRSMAARGHEIANHSLDHRYDITRLDTESMRRQVVLAADLIERAVGERPCGFRAPGYVVTDALIDVLREASLLYDSSVFPSPAYYLAKTAAMAFIRVQRRESHSIMGSPAVLLSPTCPYVPGLSVSQREEKGEHSDKLIELPIQVTPRLRLPYIGTTLTMAGFSMAKWLTRSVIGQSFINLELHGIDVLDASDGLDALVAHQPDVRVAAERKQLILSEVFGMLREAGYSFVRLKDVARRVRL